MNLINYIEKKELFGIRPGLDNIKRVMNALGNPQDELKIIHVAGTNGKGSVCNYLYNIMLSNGYSCGLFTSPHIHKIEDRFEINGKNANSKELTILAEKLKRVEDDLDIELTKFEVLTSLAFLYFHHKKCEFAVIEVGLGGIWDATNIIKKPLVSVITKIGLDHIDILGDTEEKIAYEKAGIIKENVDVIFYKTKQSINDVIRKVATQNNSKVVYNDIKQLKIIKLSKFTSIFTYKSYKNVLTVMPGFQSMNNLTLVLETVDYLKNIIKLEDDLIYKGIAKTKLKRRFEVRNTNPVTVFDCAHNVQSFQMLLKNLDFYFSKEKVVMVLGLLKDKDVMNIVRMLDGNISKLYLTKPLNNRAFDPNDLKQLFYESKTEIITSPLEAFETAIHKNPESVIAVCGSFYNYMEIE